MHRALPYSLDCTGWNSPSVCPSSSSRGRCRDSPAFHCCEGHQGPRPTQKALGRAGSKTAGQRAHAVFIWVCTARKLSGEIVLARSPHPVLPHTLTGQVDAIRHVHTCSGPRKSTWLFPIRKPSKAVYVWGARAGKNGRPVTAGPVPPTNGVTSQAVGFSSP